MTRRARLFSVVVISALLVGVASAGTTLHYGIIPQSGAEQVTLRVDSRLVRLERGKFAMLYDAASDSTTVLDLAQRTYFRTNREEATRLATQLQSTKQQVQQIMEQAMGALGEDQRKQIEQFVGNQVPMLSTPPTYRIVEMGRKETIFEIECSWIRMLEDGVPISELCMADNESVGMDATERTTVERLSELVIEMGNRFTSVSVERRPSGIPIGMNDLTVGERIRLTGVHHLDLDPGLFQIPAGFEPMSVFPGQ